MKNKGQALTEFIILLPVLMLLITGMVDFGNILYQKYQLENHLDTVVLFYQNEEAAKISDYAKQENIVATIDETGEETTLKVSKKIQVYTPGLNRILNSPYPIETKRVILNES